MNYARSSAKENRSNVYTVDSDCVRINTADIKNLVHVTYCKFSVLTMYINGHV